MVLVEHRPRVLQVEVVLGGDRPRQVAQPLEVGARDRILGGLGRDARQAVELAVGLLAHLGRHLRLLDAGLELGGFALAVVALAQLLLDRLHLLAQQELALVLVDVLLDRGADLLPDFEDLELAREHRGEGAQPLLGVERLEQLLLVLGGQVEQRGDEVGEPSRSGLLARRRHRFVGHGGNQRHDALELAHDLLDQGLGLDIVGLGLAQGLDPRLEIGLGGRVLHQTRARHALDQHREAVVREADHPQHRAEGRDSVQVGRRRLLGRRVLLAHHDDGAVAGHHVVEQLDAALAPDIER